MFEWIIIILLVAVGLALLVAELIIVPGTTLVGLAGGVLVTMGVIRTFNTFGQAAGYTVFFTAVVLGGVLTLWAFRTKSWEKFSLKDTISSRFNEEEVMNLQVGQRGKTLSSCRPVGKAEFENHSWEVRTSGGYLDAGIEVQITKIDNRNITIEPLNV
jgi:membrane-bound ClpP family serine protease